MDPNQVIIILVCLAFSAFFSGVEIAFVSANRLHIELLRKQGAISGQILTRFVKNPSQFISTTLVGNTISLVLYGYYMAGLLEPWLATSLPDSLRNDVTVGLIQTLLSTFIVIITAEYTPKSIFMINPDWLLTLFAVPILMIYYVLYPFVFIIVLSSKFVITKILRFEYSEDKPIFGLIDLNNYLKNLSTSENQNDNREVDAKIFNNALEFKTVKVRDCMVPRPEIVAVDIEDGIEELKNAFIESGHSKIVIYKNTIDEVIGYCHSLEVFKKPKDIKSILTPIIIVTETSLVNELMIQFLTERKSLALVVDEYGGTSGIVSMEDIIEEIFGEINDEHDDDEDLVEEKIDQRNYILSARLEIDYLNDRYDLNLPVGDYETLGGLILSVNENIPEVNDIIEVAPFVITVYSKTDNRIDRVKLTVQNEEDRG
ncbi:MULTISPECIES: hemolysin family protein [unclassified Imperialibacter]|uniref:hemolysin family protein n=1 Tax=unclassified Imperialibacter TaxID=2629706 RepID=UPI00125401D0|nr:MULTISPECIES: hemolysin family protein [unclassified Imperialibacter]CAD5271817.1 CBS domain containing-hemolysin-like protein [Imperialibacter sp. 89]CAD5299058.1 CBS domain containing-hemolysin-like protein [Imperialibacter sp. 75]VVT35132.1 Hemolysin [Imperialibacter sp. EC-SDR9]